MPTRTEVEDTPHTLKGLCKLARSLGYKDPFSQLMLDNGSCVGDLMDLLEDNPGACEAVIEFVLSLGVDRDDNPFEDEEDEEEDDE